MTQPPPSLPRALEHSVRTTSVPASLRGLFERIDVGSARIALDVDLPREAPIPLPARQLLRLALSSPVLALGEVRGAASLRLVARRAGASLALEGEALEADVDTVARRLLAALLSPEELARGLQTLAAESTQLGMLQAITRHMLDATDVDRALYVMLSGITSGFGLALNRAALFLFERELERGEEVFRGSKAIGPADADEAHRIWEAIELEEKSIGSLIEDYALQNFDTRLQAFVETLTLRRGDEPGDEIALALSAGAAPLRFRREAPVNASLARLRPAGEFILAAIRPHGALMGLLFADNLYGNAPISDDSLGRIRFYVDQTALVWENLSLLRKVEELARHDALTGALNRRAFDERMEEERSRASRSASPCSLMLIDVDHFKHVNDSEGHAAGDRLLVVIAELLAGALRAHDAVARFGGDEFVVLLPESGKAELARAAERIGRGAREAGVSLSIGGATYPDDAAEPTRLLEVADVHLYDAKRAGRGRAWIRGLEPIVFG